MLAFWSPKGDMVVTGAVNERFVVLWDVSDPRRPVRLRELALEDEPPPGSRTSSSIRTGARTVAWSRPSTTS